MSELFADRREAGRALAERLSAYRGVAGLLVLALPRGGVPVAAEIASALGAPLDVLVVRKVGVPRSPEVAMGALAAIAGTIESVKNPDVLASMPKTGHDSGTEAFERVAAQERIELARRQQAYRDDRPPLDLTGRTVLLVDDGIATGATMSAAIAAVKGMHPARIVMAVPVAPAEACVRLATLVDDVVCVDQPEPFWAVGQAYARFDQTSDDEVKRILAEFPAEPETSGEPGR